MLDFLTDLENDLSPRNLAENGSKIHIRQSDNHSLKTIIADCSP